MRKHPLIALTAFAALGTSAIAGSTTGTFTTSTTLASYHYTSHEAVLPFAGMHAARVVRLTAAERRHLAHGGRDLVASHDATLGAWARLDLDPATGRFWPPAPRPAVTSSAAPSVASTVAATLAAPAAAPAAPVGGVWYEIRVCESSDNYAEDTGNGYYGAYQFALSTWYGLGFSGLPSEAPPAVQDRAAEELQARSGWGQWPQCAAELGLY